MTWKGFAIILLVLGGWIVLNRWILPRCGVSTCCCPAPPPRTMISEPDRSAADIPAPIQNESERNDAKEELP